MRRAVRGAALGVLFAAALRAPAAAQQDARLLEAVRLAQAGRHDSAQALVHRLLDSLTPTDSVYPEALYTTGILGLDARTITTNLQRVVVEFAQSPWADDALLRLTQYHFAQADYPATTQSAERMRRDYPDSPLLARAVFPAARAYFKLNDEARGCGLLREAYDGAGSDVELRNQVEFYAARCSSVATDTGAPRRGYSVQVMAVRAPQQVDEMLTRLKVMGYAARVVRDTSGFFKIRVGPYTTRAEANEARGRLRTRLGGQPFVVEES